MGGGRGGVRPGFPEGFGGRGQEGESGHAPGYYVQEVLLAAGEETGVATTTISHYIQTRGWKPANRPLRTQAKLLAGSARTHPKSPR